MKKTYQQPEVRAVALLQQGPLLSGSDGFRGEISGYETNAGGGFSQEEED